VADAPDGVPDAVSSTAGPDAHEVRTSAPAAARVSAAHRGERRDLGAMGTGVLDAPVMDVAVLEACVVDARAVV